MNDGEPEACPERQDSRQEPGINGTDEQLGEGSRCPEQHGGAERERDPGPEVRMVIISHGYDLTHPVRWKHRAHPGPGAPNEERVIEPVVDLRGAPEVHTMKRSVITAAFILCAAP